MYSSSLFNCIQVTSDHAQCDGKTILYQGQQLIEVILTNPRGNIGISRLQSMDDVGNFEDANGLNMDNFNGLIIGQNCRF